MERYITSETTIGDIINKYPQTVEVLLAGGMHCLGCPASQGESLANACAVHGLEVRQVEDDVNKAIAAAQAAI